MFSHVSERGLKPPLPHCQAEEELMSAVARLLTVFMINTEKRALCTCASTVSVGNYLTPMA